ncbi:hypothetical protein M422DRAFT_266166 [Sphaerobolus stellatus SS14]|nr:hypothetical protein M422DRAFT_266166 [Sphaerobolus stellatus SS14]
MVDTTSSKGKAKQTDTASHPIPKAITIPKPPTHSSHPSYASSSSSSDSPILTPSPELQHAHIQIPNIPTTMDMDMGMGIHIPIDTADVKKELLTDIPAPRASPAPSDASHTSNASKGSVKRKRNAVVDLDAVGSSEMVEMGKTRSGRVVKRRKME